MKQSKGAKSYLVPILCAVFALLLGAMAFALLRSPAREIGEFTPPPFEENAVSGVPDVPDDLGYSAPYKEGMSYRFSICGNVMTEGTDAVVYLTNPSDGEVWMKVRILDSKGKILGESGLIKPGEYVRSVALSYAPAAGTEIKLKIMGYEPETYYSAGSATLNTVIGGNAE